MTMSMTVSTAAPTVRAFTSDNVAGAAPQVTDAAARAASGPTPPYGAGDISAQVRRRLCEIFERELDVFLVSTGAVYSLDELRTLGSITKQAGLRLHMDGARFAGALAALGCTPAEMSWQAGVDLLSFGAAKNGTMTADAVVVFDRSLTPELAFRAKRAGQLAATMRFHAARRVAALRS